MLPPFLTAHLDSETRTRNTAKNHILGPTVMKLQVVQVLRIESKETSICSDIFANSNCNENDNDWIIFYYHHYHLRLFLAYVCLFVPTAVCQ